MRNVTLLLVFLTSIQVLFAQIPGTLKWEFQTGYDIWSSPAIGSDGTIYIGSLDSHLYAINPDGSQKWDFLTGGESYSSPAIGSDGTIYFGSLDSNLYAINPDCSQKWEFLTGGKIYSSPAIGSDGTIYIGSLDSNLYAINPDGNLKWEYLTNWSVHSSPVIGPDGTIYISSDSLIALNPDGTKKWESQTFYENSSLAIGSDGTIYVSESNPGSWPVGFLRAVNPDGNTMWIISFGIWSDPTHLAIGSDGTIFVKTPLLIAINPDSTIKWSFYESNDPNVYSSPAIGSDGTVYAGLGDDKLYAVSSNGTKKWESESTGPVSSSPAIGSDSTLYVGSLDGKIYAVYGESGGLANGPWPRFRHDNQNTGNASHTITKINKKENITPNNYSLKQNFPNPFNPTTTIEFSIPKTEFVTLKIYNLLGQEVATLVSERSTAGTYKYDWDASGFASGIYPYRLKTEAGFMQVRKLVVIK